MFCLCMLLKEKRLNNFLQNEDLIKEIRMIKKGIFAALICTGLLISSCDTLMQVGQIVLEESTPLTTDEVSRGLKEALSVGVDSAVVRLSKEGGYYLQEQMRINLPPEADIIVDNISKIPGMDNMMDEMVLKLNRAAEDAAITAAPIFASAINEMTIQDAWGILRGADTAAVHYLRQKTEKELYVAFKPIVAESLNKPIIANLSASDSWNTVSANWNGFAGSFAGQMLGLEAVHANLDEYVTQKALDGLFYQVAQQEKEIRNDANARVSDLLQKVFGN